VNYPYLFFFFLFSRSGSFRSYPEFFLFSACELGCQYEHLSSFFSPFPLPPQGIPKKARQAYEISHCEPEFAFLIAYLRSFRDPFRGPHLSPFFALVEKNRGTPRFLSTADLPFAKPFPPPPISNRGPFHTKPLSKMPPPYAPGSSFCAFLFFVWSA